MTIPFADGSPPHLGVSSIQVGFDKAFVAIYVIGWAKTRELKKFAYKMGLIEVSKINGKVRPIDRRIVLDESPGLLKPLNPAE